MTRAQPRLAVLHAVPGSWLPVTQNWLYQQVRNLPADVRSHIVCTHREHEDVFPGAHVHAMRDRPRLKQWRDRVARAARIRRHSTLLDDVVREHQPGILHSHFGNVACDNLALARRHGLPHVVTFYGLDVNYLPQRGWLKRYRSMFAEVDLVLCEGPHMASCIVELGCPKHKVEVQRLGVDVNAIAFNARSYDRSVPLRVLLAAEFREKKGLPCAIDAIGRFRQRTATPIEVTIIGEAGSSRSNREQKRQLLRLIQQHELRDHVRMLGRQPHAVLMAEAARHHVFMHPSVTAMDGQTEGGAPVVLLDMAAAGLPIITSRHCDIPEIIIPGVTGLLAEERDVEDLAAQLEYTTLHPEHCAAMASRARRHVEENYNAARQGPQLAARYWRLLGLESIAIEPVTLHQQPTLRKAA